MKKNKTIFIISSVLVGLIGLTLIYLTLILTNVIETRKPKIVLEAEKVTCTYTGSKVTCNKYSILSGELLPGHHIEPIMIGSLSEVGYKEVDFSVSIFDEADVDVTSKYDITCNPGSITINPIELTIKSGSISKEYLDTYLNNEFPIKTQSDDYELVSGSLIDGDRLVVDITGELYDVGKCDNTMNAYVINSNNVDVSRNYTFNYQYGELECKQIKLTVKTDGKSKIYNGESLEFNSFQQIGNNLMDGHELHVEVIGTITDVGTCENTINAYVLDREGRDVSKYYNIECIPGTLEVEPIDLYFSTDSFTKEYDGTSLKGNGLREVSVPLISGHMYKYTFNSEITDVGEAVNSCYITIVDQYGNNVSKNYDIHIDYGMLKVTGKTITIRTNSNSNTLYDGNPRKEDYFEDPIGLLEGHTFVRRSEFKTITDVIRNENKEAVGIENSFTYDIVDKNNNSVLQCYNVIEEWGTLYLRPIQLYITTSSRSKEYDGIVLGSEEYELIGSILDSHYMTVNFFNTLTNVGMIANRVLVKITDIYDTDVTFDYDIYIEEGTLEITRRSITLYSSDLTKEYNGIPLEATRPTIISGSLVVGDTIEYSDVNVVSFTDELDSNKPNTINVYNSLGEDVSDNYDFSDSIFGTISITPKNMYIQTGSSEKTYDGLYLSNSNNTYVVNMLTTDTLYIIDEGLEYSINDAIDHYRKVKDVLIDERTKEYTYYLNSFNYVIRNSNGVDVTKNYYVNELWGKLTIKPINVVLRTNSITGTYNGEYYTGDYFSDLYYNFLIDSILPGETFINIDGFISVCDCIYNNEGELSSYENRINYKVVNAIGDDVTKNYKFNEMFGEIKIYPKDVNVVIDNSNNSKYYDGTVLSYKIDNSKFVSQSGLLNNHSINIIENIYSLIDAGKIELSKVVINDIQVLDNDNKNCSKNYNINVSINDLIVKKARFIVVTDSSDKVFDGTPLTCSSYTVTNKTFSDTLFTVVAETNGTITYPGQTDNTLLYVSLIDENGEEVDFDNYEYEERLGILVVKTFEGDGSQLTNTKFTPDNEVLFELLSNQSNEYIYLRNQSYSTFDKNTNSWINNFTNEVFEYNPLYLTSSALEKVGKTTNSLTITMSENSYNSRFLPYYISNYITSDLKNYNDDIHVRKNYNKTYSLNFYDYNYLREGKYACNSDYRTLEEIYREFVYSNYLTVDSDYEPFLRNILSSNGISLNDDKSNVYEVISYIVDYINNNYTYNLDFVGYNLNETSVVNFLNIKEGICQHFASLTCLLLQSCGIPCRYVTGFCISNVNSGSTIGVTSEYAHSWVEVYIDGMGWIILDTLAEANTDIFVKLLGKDFVYDGTYQSYEAFQVLENSLPSGFSLKMVNPLGLKDALSSELNSCEDFIVLDKNGNDVSNKYTVHVVESEYINILKREIELDIKGKTFIYSGDECYYDSTHNDSDGFYEVISGSFALNHTFVYLGTSGYIIPGTYLNGYRTMQILDEGYENVKDNYDITLNIGNIIIEKRNLSIDINGDTLEFDNNYHYVDTRNYSYEAYTIVDGSLNENEDFSFIGFSFKSIGEYSNVPDTYYIMNSNNDNVTDYYNITINSINKVIITKRHIKLLTGSHTWDYDGTYKVCDEVSFIIGSLASDHELQIAYPKIKDVGMIVNEPISFNIVNGSLESCLDYYYIEWNYGLLTVNGYGNISFIMDYCGERYSEHSSIYADVSMIIPDMKFQYLMTTYNFTYTATVSGSQIGLGSSPSKITSINIYDENGDEITGYFSIQLVDGTLCIYNDIITITTGGLTKQYDGISFYNPTFTYTGDLVSGDRIVIDESCFSSYDLKPKNSKRTIGYNNISNYKILDSSDNDVTSNYYIIMNPGVFICLPIDIIISTEDIYISVDELNNGIDDYIEISSVTLSSLLNNHHIASLVYVSDDIIYDCEGTQIISIISVRIYDEFNNDVTSCYNILYYDDITIEVY